MESTEVNNIDLYKALCVIKNTCLNHPTSCKGCPLSIEINKIDENNNGYSHYICRVYNQQSSSLSRPDTWKLRPPASYSPFSDS